MARTVWPSAESLAAYFSESPQLVQGLRVLELGSGTGLCGLVLGKLGASRVALTDYNSDAIDLLEDNIEANQLGSTCSAHQLVWGEVENSQQILSAIGGEKFDIVLGTDVVYEPECIDPLLSSALHFLKPTGSLYLANHVARYRKFSQIVSETAQKLGLEQSVQPSFVGKEGQVDFSIFKIACESVTE